MTTADLIEAIRADIKHELREEILAELQPEIKRQLYSNIFDISEACRYLKVSDKTVRRMIKENGLPHFWQRGQLFFQQDSLSRWVSKKERMHE